jgi:hypothetical protein
MLKYDFNSVTNRSLHLQYGNKVAIIGKGDNEIL